jgi:hypothetical protein
MFDDLSEVFICIGFLAFIVVLLWVMVSADNAADNICTQKGGILISQYTGESLCVKKDIIL